MWACICGEHNAPGLAQCPICGKSRVSAKRDVSGDGNVGDNLKTQSAPKSRLNGALNRLVAAGLDIDDMAKGLATGRVTGILRVYQEGAAMDAYREVVEYLMDAGYPVSHYLHTVVSWTATSWRDDYERTTLDTILNENDNREPPLDNEALEPPQDDLPF